jgi:dihydroorotate dehydrogenase electron transfer subunit
MKNDEFIVLKISETLQETPDVKSFFFNYDLKAKPGQFVMLWLPGVGEKPISVSGCKKGKFQLTVCGVGNFSNAVLKLQKGDKLGFRGPFGTSYSLPKGKGAIALLGGGYGSAPLAFLAEEAIAAGRTVYFIEGARTKERLLFGKRMSEAGAHVHFATDDGSFGIKGYATDILSNLLKEEKISKVFTCGPEIMMKKAIGICDESKVPIEVSMERYMKCGIGVCGQCAVDDLGICLCREGPILDGKTAMKIKEFGAYHRDASGKIIR